MEPPCDLTARDARKILVALLLLEVCLAAVFLVDTLLVEPVGRCHRLFDLDAEGNIPAWFSSIQLLLVGLLFLLEARRPNPSTDISRRFLLSVGIGFILLSADESAQLHETVGQILRHFDHFPGFPRRRGTWIPVYLAVAGVLLFVFLRDIKTVWSRYRREALLMAAGAGVFLLGVVGLEIVNYVALKDYGGGALYAAEVAVEELFEMAGISLVLYGGLLFAFRRGG